MRINSTHIELTANMSHYASHQRGEHRTEAMTGVRQASARPADLKLRFSLHSLCVATGSHSLSNHHHPLDQSTRTGQYRLSLLLFFTIESTHSPHSHFSIFCQLQGRGFMLRPPIGISKHKKLFSNSLFTSVSSLNTRQDLYSLCFHSSAK